MSAHAGKREQPWVIRAAHWAMVPLLAIMAGSGLEILKAYPFLGPIGATYGWWPLQGYAGPPSLRLGGWLAGARAWHFAFAWLLVGNASVYLAYTAVTGEWRERFFLPLRDARSAVQTALHYLRLRKAAPPQGLYNGLQRAAYSAALGLGVVEVLSGIAIYKPVQLGWLAAIFGGYDGARAVHLLGLAALALFVAGHVVLVLLHPRSLLAMITGGRRRE